MPVLRLSNPYVQMRRGERIAIRMQILVYW